MLQPLFSLPFFTRLFCRYGCGQYGCYRVRARAASSHTLKIERPESSVEIEVRICYSLPLQVQRNVFFPLRAWYHEKISLIMGDRRNGCWTFAELNQWMLSTAQNRSGPIAYITDEKAPEMQKRLLVFRPLMFRIRPSPQLPMRSSTRAARSEICPTHACPSAHTPPTLGTHSRYFYLFPTLPIIRKLLSKCLT